MKCCANCFGDRGLRNEIIPFRSAETGRCSYCHSDGQQLVEPGQLAEYFGVLTSIYRPGEGGKTLCEWLKEDWLLFDHERMDLANAKVLLADILDDGEIVRKNFVPPESDGPDSLEQWNRFREELMYENRFFPENIPDTNRLQRWLGSLIIEPADMPQFWHRARIQKENRDYSIDEMGAPEKRKAGHGRANPAGIPYLYLGSTPQTVVSEVRPHPGQTIFIAKNTISNELKIIDLRNPRKLVSPFQLEDEEMIVQLRADVPFLEQLGQELKRPVLPTSAAIDYLPSQYLCEFIKKCGYHGVVYGSSVSSGINLALFDPENANRTAIMKYVVSSVLVEANEVS